MNADFIKPFSITIVDYRYGEWKTKTIRIHSIYTKPHEMRQVLDDSIDDDSGEKQKWKTSDGQSLDRFDRCSFYTRLLQNGFQLIRKSLYRWWSRLQMGPKSKPVDSIPPFILDDRWTKYIKDNISKLLQRKVEWKNTGAKSRLVSVYNDHLSKCFLIVYHRWQQKRSRLSEEDLQKKAIIHCSDRYTKGWMKNIDHPFQTLWMDCTKTILIISVMIVLFYIIYIMINLIHPCLQCFLFQPKKHNH
jgi:hypothetical protein